MRKSGRWLCQNVLSEEGKRRSLVRQQQKSKSVFGQCENESDRATLQITHEVGSRCLGPRHSREERYILKHSRHPQLRTKRRTLKKARTDWSLVVSSNRFEKRRDQDPLHSFSATAALKVSLNRSDVHWGVGWMSRAARVEPKTNLRSLSFRSLILSKRHRRVILAGSPASKRSETSGIGVDCSVV